MEILNRYFGPEGPGAALAVAVDGEAPHVECMGCSNREPRMAITPDTRFELASASKMFTAAATVLLAARDEIDLLEPASNYLPELAGGGEARAITVRDLLWHTSGLADYLEAGAATPVENLSTKSVLARLAEWAAQAVPGGSHTYANTNYVCLARIVEVVSGWSFADFARTNLFEPCGMAATAMLGDGVGMSDAAIGYQNLGYGIPCFEAVPPSPIDTVGDGGVISTLNDLLRWHEAFWSGDLLDEGARTQMVTPGTLDSGETFPYGMGLQVETWGEAGPWCGHGGSWTNASVLMGRYVEPATTLIVLSNEWMAPVAHLHQRAFARSLARRRCSTVKVTTGKKTINTSA